jgi:ethanolamine utilization protein EutN
MIMGHVVGRVWTERQHPGLDGRRLLIVRDELTGQRSVAVDLMGANEGSRVLVATDQGVLPAVGSEVPTDAVIVALVAGSDSAAVPVADDGAAV